MRSDRLALDRLDLLIVLQVLREDGGPSNHVVREDVDKLGLILGLEEAVQRSLGQLSERLVARREDGEGTRAFQCVDERSSTKRINERGEVWCGRCDLHDVLCRCRWR